MKATVLPMTCRIFAASTLILLFSPAARGSDSGLSQPPFPPDLPILEVPEGPAPNWIEHFDTYTTGSEMIGQGGWEGWAGSATVGALTSATQLRSAPNSIDVLGDTDLVHQYAGYTSGVWTYTAYLYLPAGETGKTYFILLNTYPATVFGHWSVQLCFDGAAGVLRDDLAGTCVAPSTTTLVRDQWVEIRVIADLTANTQTVFYNSVLFYTAPWSTHLGPEGAISLRAVDLFGNNAGSAFWDDLSLSNLPFSDGFEGGDTNSWHETVAQ
ncbi:MAG: hypothetical protein ABIV06_00965 [Thermoanaerobaculia bacterium]